MLEQEKYQEVWKHEQYRTVAPGEHCVDLFLQLAKPKATDTITDYGAGTGRAALKLADAAKVRMLDFTTNSLDPIVQEHLNERLVFAQHDLTQPITDFTKYGYCCDVMEHIPPEDVLTVLKNITQSCRHCFFQISCVPDVMGALIGEQLHLTVQPYSWWLDRFNEIGCAVRFSKDLETHCLFYVSAWANGGDVAVIAKVNTEDEEIRANVKHNIQLGLSEAKPYEQQEQELIILAGGPSLNDFKDEILINKKMGLPIVTLNGAYNWAIEHGIKPDVQIILDAREFNKRFLEPIVPTCKYLLSSQCHPNLIKSVPPEQVTLWHSGAAVVRSVVEELGIERDVYPVYGGMTVPLRAIPLLIMLGFHRFVIYGFDSCLKKDEHHAYAQPENDYNTVLEVECGGRYFKCHGWMVSQAQEWLQLQDMIADLCEIEVKGDGLIAHTIRTGADIAKTKTIGSETNI